MLKTIEEPPASTVFVILAEYVPPELITIASRCVEVDFDPLTPAEVVAALEAGVEPTGPPSWPWRLEAASTGPACWPTTRGSRPAGPPGVSIPARLDGTGATAAAFADELIGLLDSSVEPLRTRHEAERAALEERNAKALEVTGRGAAGPAAGR